MCTMWEQARDFGRFYSDLGGDLSDIIRILTAKLTGFREDPLAALVRGRVGGGGGQCHSEGYVQGLQDCACRRDGRTPILWTEIGRYGHAKKDPIISKRDLI